MLRPLLVPSLLITSCLAAAGAHAQSETGVKIEPYTGPPVFLDDVPAAVPATRVENSVKTDKYDNGKVWVERGVTRFSDNSFVSDGIYREFYRNGQQFVEGRYKNGEPVGEWAYWHSNGQESKRVAYKGGQPDGQVEVRRPDGTLEARKNYALGKREGKWEVFNDAGEELLQEQYYAAGTPTGVWKWWYASGQPQREAAFEEGQMTGLAKEWADDGSLRAEVNFKDGKRHGVSKQWLADGRMIEQLYENGAPVRKAE